MKLINAVAGLALCAGLIGCGKQETPAPSAVPAEAPKAAAPAEAPTAAAPAAPAAPAVAADTVAQAQGLITKVKDSIAQKDYAGALSTLKELSAIKLTPEQQKIVDDLKAQVQQAMTGAASSDLGKSAGGLLGK